MSSLSATAVGWRISASCLHLPESPATISHVSTCAFWGAEPRFPLPVNHVRRRAAE